MKRPLAIVVLTVIVTSLVWHVLGQIRKSYETTWLISAVKAPGRMALETILADLREGRSVTGTARLMVLRESWARFEAERGYAGNGIGDIMTEFRDMPMPAEVDRDTGQPAAP